MNIEELVGRFGVLAATFLVSLVSGLVPVVNVEVYLVALAALSRTDILPVLTVATLGQMTAKVALYLTGAGVVSLSRRYEAKVEEYKVRFQRWEGRTDLLIFTSAALGFPPFLIVSPLAGVFRTGLLRFFVWGSLGRFLRFAAVFIVPRLIRDHWP